MRAGYKQTEVGVIPEDWGVNFIRQICDVDPENLSSSTPPEYKFLYVSLESVKNGLVNQYVEYSFKNAPSRARRILKKGDVVFGTVRPNLKSHFYVDENVKNLVCSTGFCVIRPFPERVLNYYIFLHLFGPILTHQIEFLLVGSNYPAVNSGDVKNLLVPLPPTLEEQRKIAGALSDMDELISSLEKLIEKKKAIKQGSMQKLLTGKTRLPGFTQQPGYKPTEVGVIPEDWWVKELGQLGSMFKGKGISKSDVNTGSIPCIRYGELYTLYHNHIKQVKSTTSAEAAILSQEIQYGDILFAGSGETKEEIGKCAVFSQDHVAFAGGDIIILRLVEGNPLFLGYSLNSELVQNQKASRGQGDAIVHIYPTNLSDILIPLPPTLEEQQAIARVLSDMDEEIQQLQTKVKKYRKLKQGMMQELLTGKTRLV